MASDTSSSNESNIESPVLAGASLLRFQNGMVEDEAGCGCEVLLDGGAGLDARVALVGRPAAVDDEGGVQKGDLDVVVTARAALLLWITSRMGRRLDVAVAFRGRPAAVDDEGGIQKEGLDVVVIVRAALLLWITSRMERCLDVVVGFPGRPAAVEFGVESLDGLLRCWWWSWMSCCIMVMEAAYMDAWRSSLTDMILGK